jgi:hypothetical protein
MLTPQAQAVGDAAEADSVHPVIERVARQTAEKPAQVRFMPKLGILYVKGSGKLVRQLLEQDEVESATANEADVAVPEARGLTGTGGGRSGTGACRKTTSKVGDH